MTFGLWENQLEVEDRGWRSIFTILGSKTINLKFTRQIDKRFNYIVYTGITTFDLLYFTC